MGKGGEGERKRRERDGIWREESAFSGPAVVARSSGLLLRLLLGPAQYLLLPVVYETYLE